MLKTERKAARRLAHVSMTFLGLLCVSFLPSAVFERGQVLRPLSPRLDAEGNPPPMPCRDFQSGPDIGGRAGSTDPGPPAALVMSMGMPPALPSIPVVLPNGMRVTPVQERVYMLAGAGGNIALQVGSEGALLVDSGTADRAEAVIATLRQLTASPIRLIINTTAAADHTGGNDPLMRTGRRFATAFGRTAATARRHGLTIATGNDRDFRRPGLKVFNPFKELK